MRKIETWARVSKNWAETAEYEVRRDERKTGRNLT